MKQGIDCPHHPIMVAYEIMNEQPITVSVDDKRVGLSGAAALQKGVSFDYYSKDIEIKQPQQELPGVEEPEGTTGSGITTTESGITTKTSIDTIL